jgi:hypothetical protein
MATNQVETGESQARRLETAAAEMSRILRERDAERRKRSAQGDAEWSGMQIAGHVVEMVPYWFAHIETIIAAPEPPTFGRGPDSPERLAGPEYGAAADADVLAVQVQDTLKHAADRIRRLSPEERAKKGIHIRRGEMTAGDVVELMIVAHAEEHLEQLKKS